MTTYGVVVTVPWREFDNVFEVEVRREDVDELRPVAAAHAAVADVVGTHVEHISTYSTSFEDDEPGDGPWTVCAYDSREQNPSVIEATVWVTG